MEIRGRGLKNQVQDNNTATRKPQDEGDLVSMSGFKEPSLADRQKAAQDAKQQLLSKFRARPAADDPMVLQQQVKREAQAAQRAKAKVARDAARAEQQAREAEEAAARAKAKVARDAAKAEQKAREAEAAAQAAKQLAAEKAEAAARETALEAERKAARDKRYAARKKKRK